MIKRFEPMNHTWKYKRKVLFYLIYFKIFYIKEIIQLKIFNTNPNKT